MCRDRDGIDYSNGDGFAGRVGNDNNQDDKDGYNNGWKSGGGGGGEQGGCAGAATEATSVLNLENDNDDGVVVN
jgi:hypothetical protein